MIVHIIKVEHLIYCSVYHCVDTNVKIRIHEWIAKVCSGPTPFNCIDFYVLLPYDHVFI